MPCIWHKQSRRLGSPRQIQKLELLVRKTGCLHPSRGSKPVRLSTMGIRCLQRLQPAPLLPSSTQPGGGQGLWLAPPSLRISCVHAGM